MNNTKVASRVFVPACAALFLVAGPVSAASISYYLDQSNSAAVPDGVNYLKVTIADGADGAIDFTVEALGSLVDHAAGNFGIQAFAFNVIPGGDAEGANVANLPDGWIVRDGYRMASFGFFDIKLYGGGNSRLDTLTFSIVGVDGDTPTDYASLSTGNSADGQQFFAAHVGDLALECAKPGSCVTSAFFGGSTVSSPVPLPATAWLFGTGLVGAVLRSRRRARKA